MAYELLGVTIPLGLLLGAALGVLIFWLLLNYWDRQRTLHFVKHLYSCKCAAQSEEQAEISADGTNSLTSAERQMFSDRLLLTELDVRKTAESAAWCAFESESLVLPLRGYATNQLRAHRTVDLHDVALASFFDGRLLSAHADALAHAAGAYVQTLSIAEAASDRLLTRLRQVAAKVRSRNLEAYVLKLTEKGETLKVKNNRKVGKLIALLKERDVMLQQTVDAFSDSQRNQLRALFDAESQNEVDTLKFRLWLKQMACFEAVRKQCWLRMHADLKVELLACVTEELRASELSQLSSSDRKKERADESDESVSGASQEKIEKLVEEIQTCVFDFAKKHFDAEYSRCRAFIEERFDWFAIELLKLSELANMDAELVFAHAKVLSNVVEKLRGEEEIKPLDADALLENLKNEQTLALAAATKHELEVFRAADDAFQPHKTTRIQELLASQKAEYEQLLATEVRSMDPPIESKSKTVEGSSNQSPMQKARVAAQTVIELRVQLMSKQHATLLDTLRELDTEAIKEVTRLDEELLRERMETVQRLRDDFKKRVSDAPYNVNSEFFDSILHRQQQQLSTIQQMVEKKKEQVVTLLKEKKDVAKQMRSNYQKQDELERNMLMRHQRLITEKMIDCQILLSNEDRDRVNSEVSIRVAGVCSGVTLRRIKVKINLTKALEARKKKLLGLISAVQNRQLDDLRSRSVLVSDSKSSSDVNAEAQLLTDYAMVRIDIQQNLSVSAANRALARLSSLDERDQRERSKDRDRSRRRDAREREREREQEREQDAEFTQAFTRTMDIESEKIRIELLRDAAHSVKRDEDEVGEWLAALQLSKARQACELELQNELLAVMRALIIEDLVVRGVLRDTDTEQMLRQCKFDRDSVLGEVDKQIATLHRTFKKQAAVRVRQRQLAVQLSHQRAVADTYVPPGRYAQLLKKTVLEHRSKLQLEHACALIEKQAAQTQNDFDREMELRRSRAALDCLTAFVRSLFTRHSQRRREDDLVAPETRSLAYEVCRATMPLQNQALLAFVNQLWHKLQVPIEPNASNEAPHALADAKSSLEQLAKFDCAKPVLGTKLRAVLNDALAALLLRDDAGRPIDVLVRDERYTPRSRDRQRSVTFKDDLEMRRSNNTSSAISIRDRDRDREANDDYDRESAYPLAARPSLDNQRSESLSRNKLASIDRCGNDDERSYDGATLAKNGLLDSDRLKKNDLYPLDNLRRPPLKPLGLATTDDAKRAEQFSSRNSYGNTRGRIDEEDERYPPEDEHATRIDTDSPSSLRDRDRDRNRYDYDDRRRTADRDQRYDGELQDAEYRSKARQNEDDDADDLYARKSSKDRKKARDEYDEDDAPSNSYSRSSKSRDRDVQEQDTRVNNDDKDDYYSQDKQSYGGKQASSSRKADEEYSDRRAGYGNDDDDANETSTRRKRNDDDDVNESSTRRKRNDDDDENDDYGEKKKKKKKRDRDRERERERERDNDVDEDRERPGDEDGDGDYRYSRRKSRKDNDNEDEEIENRENSRSSKSKKRSKAYNRDDDDY